MDNSIFEVICTTMLQSDISKFEEMNINSDIIFANQFNEYSYKRNEINGHLVQMITTTERGVGKNRNQGLLSAKGSICIFADDDLIYYSDYQEKILRAFNEKNDADIILFNLSSTTPNSVRKPTKIKSFKRLHKWNRCPYGGPRIAFKRDSIIKANIWFSLLFGGGCIYSCGEDSLFIKEALKKGLHIYINPSVIAKTDYEKSSWFKGYSFKYYYDKGAYIQASNPGLCLFLILYYCIREIKNKELSFRKKYSLMKNGAKGYKNLKSYEKYRQELENTCERINYNS